MMGPVLAVEISLLVGSEVAVWPDVAAWLAFGFVVALAVGFFLNPLVEPVAAWIERRLPAHDSCRSTW